MVPTIHAPDTYGCRRVALQGRGCAAATESWGEPVWGREVKMFQMSVLGMLGDTSLKIANPPSLLTHPLAQLLEELEDTGNFEVIYPPNLGSPATRQTELPPRLRCGTHNSSSTC